MILSPQLWGVCDLRGHQGGELPGELGLRQEHGLWVAILSNGNRTRKDLSPLEKPNILADGSASRGDGVRWPGLLLAIPAKGWEKRKSEHAQRTRRILPRLSCLQ